MSEERNEESGQAYVVMATDPAMLKLTRKDVAQSELGLGLDAAEVEDLLQGLGELMRAVPKADTRTLTGHPCWPIRKTLVRVAARLPERGRVHELIGYMRRIPAIASRIDLDSLAANPIGFGRWLAIVTEYVSDEIGQKAEARLREREEAARAPYRRLKRPTKHEHEREPQPGYAQAAPMPVTPAPVSSPIAPPAMPAARAREAPTKKTIEQIGVSGPAVSPADFEAHYYDSLLTAEERTYVDTLNGPERRKAIYTLATEHIRQDEIENAKSERERKREAARRKMTGG